MAKSWIVTRVFTVAAALDAAGAIKIVPSIGRQTTSIINMNSAMAQLHRVLTPLHKHIVFFFCGWPLVSTPDSVHCEGLPPLLRCWARGVVELVYITISKVLAVPFSLQHHNVLPRGVTAPSAAFSRLEKQT
jgi:hypothetical protein